MTNVQVCACHILENQFCMQDHQMHTLKYPQPQIPCRQVDRYYERLGSVYILAILLYLAKLYYWWVLSSSPYWPHTGIKGPHYNYTYFFSIFKDSRLRWLVTNPMPPTFCIRILTQLFFLRWRWSPKVPCSPWFLGRLFPEVWVGITSSHGRGGDGQVARGPARPHSRWRRASFYVGVKKNGAAYQ